LSTTPRIIRGISQVMALIKGGRMAWVIMAVPAVFNPYGCLGPADRAGIIGSRSAWGCAAVPCFGVAEVHWRPRQALTALHQAVALRPRLALGAAARWAWMRSSSTLAGSSFGSWGTSSPRKALARMLWVRRSIRALAVATLASS